MSVPFVFVLRAHHNELTLSVHLYRIACDMPVHENSAVCAERSHKPNVNVNIK